MSLPHPDRARRALAVALLVGGAGGCGSSILLGGTLGDADVDQAAWYMRKLQGDDAFARDLGARSKAYIRQNFSQQTIGAIYKSRLQKLGLVQGD